MADLLPKNRIGRYVEERRCARGWRFGDVARACGAETESQIAKLSQQLVAVERDFNRDETLLRRIAAALDLDLEVLNGLLTTERAEEVSEAEAWLNEPVAPEIFAKAGPIWTAHRVPSSAAIEQDAVEYARQFSTTRPFSQVVLHWNRRVRYYFHNGEHTGTRVATEPEDSPHMTIAGKAFVFEI